MQRESKASLMEAMYRHNLRKHYNLNLRKNLRVLTAAYPIHLEYLILALQEPKDLQFILNFGILWNLMKRLKDLIMKPY